MTKQEETWFVAQDDYGIHVRNRETGTGLGGFTNVAGAENAAAFLNNGTPIADLEARLAAAEQERGLLQRKYTNRLNRSLMYHDQLKAAEQREQQAVAALRKAESVLKWLVLDDGKYDRATVIACRADVVEAIANLEAQSVQAKPTHLVCVRCGYDGLGDFTPCTDGTAIHDYGRREAPSVQGGTA